MGAQRAGGVTDDGLSPGELSRRLDYYKRQLDKLAGDNLRKDYAISAARQDIKQKRTGFAVLAQLQKTLAGRDALGLLDTAMRAIHTSLGMAGTLVLVPAGPNLYVPVRWIGLGGDHEPELAAPMAATAVALPDGFASGQGWLLVTKATPDTPMIAAIRAAFALPYFVAVPVHADGRTLGVLVTGRRKELVPSAHPLNEGDVETLTAIAGLIANVVQNAQIAALEDALIALRHERRRVREELAAARSIQQALLPAVPVREGALGLDALYQPSEELSGDFFDHAVVGDWLYFYVADVTSHGTAAAQVTYLLKGLFHDALREPVSLADLLAAVQRRYATYGLEYDVAIQLVRVHAATLQLDYLAASAPPAVRVRGGEGETIAVPPSPRLTCRPDVHAAPARWHQRTIALAAGDRLYFFTDGCYELSAGGRPLGLARLGRIYRGLPDAGWRAAALDALVAAHGGAVFEDDLTIVRLAVSGG
jgi:serine phosphatase RsbU (regulator of sigma subunit)